MRPECEQWQPGPPLQTLHAAWCCIAVAHRPQGCSGGEGGVRGLLGWCQTSAVRARAHGARQRCGALACAARAAATGKLHASRPYQTAGSTQQFAWRFSGTVLGLALRPCFFEHGCCSHRQTHCSLPPLSTRSYRSRCNRSCLSSLHMLIIARNRACQMTASATSAGSPLQRVSARIDGS